MVSTSGINQANRRRILKSLGAASVVGLAGCTGDDNGGGNGGGNGNNEDVPEGFDPEQNIVSLLLSQAEGNMHDIIGRAWADSLTENFPESIDVTVENLQGAQGQIYADELYTSPTHGGIIGLSFLDEIFLYQQENSDAEASDYEWMGSLLSSIRGISVNPRTRDIDQHFDWQWEDLVESAKEDPLDIALVIPLQEIAIRILFMLSDDISEDDYNFIRLESGGEARAAFERGDLDMYPESFANAYATERDQYYKAQILFANPETNPDLAESLQEAPSNDGDVDGVPESAYLPNQSIDEEIANLAVGATYNEVVIGAPPGTSDEIVEYHQEIGQESTDHDSIMNVFDDISMPELYNPIFDADHVQSLFEEREEYVSNNEQYEEVLNAVEL